MDKNNCVAIRFIFFKETYDKKVWFLFKNIFIIHELYLTIIYNSTEII